jgi:hypothetical protein
MNWREFLPLAIQLAAGTSEAAWRTAISRTYYAAFHVGHRLLRDLRFTVPRADRAHQYLVFRLSNSSEATVEQAGRDLETLRRLRNRADYDELPPLTQSQATALFESPKLSFKRSILLSRSQPAPRSGMPSSSTSAMCLGT